MGFQNIFRRYELKYLISDEQRKSLCREMNGIMTADKWGRSIICNLYYDTPDYLLIRRSVEKPVYKEKLRVRSYGTATPDTVVFTELKKKYKSVVYKRRLPMKERDAMLYLSGRSDIERTQITRELDYCLSFYSDLAPRVYLAYEREAFFDKNDKEFRITFDKNILWRTNDLSLCSPVYGENLLPEGYSLMEIKTATAIPLWLTGFLSRNKIYKVSFSKYGNVYKTIKERGLD